MGKRDTYRDPIDWDAVDQAYAEQQHERDMRELMQTRPGHALAIIVDECRWGNP